MDTKDIKGIEIVAPEGYEIDKEKSTLEKIIFKKKDDKPRSWEEFCKRGFTGEEAHINVSGITKSSHKKGDYKHITEVGYVASVEEAEAFQALMQLRQLRKAWVGDWEPDWTSTSLKGIITCYRNEIIATVLSYYNGVMSFPTDDMAHEFLECFKDLLEQAKILL